MGEPVSATLAVIGMVGSLGSGLLQAKAELEAGEAAYESAQYNRMLYLQTGSAEAERRHRIGRRKIGQQAAAIGKSGVQFEGSVLDRLAQNAAEYEVDSLNAIWDAKQKAEAERRRGNEAWRSARRGAGAALLSGATRAISSGMSSGMIPTASA